MANPVPVEVTEMYIDVYYHAKYPVDEEKQPLFWEAVKLLAIDIEADVSKYIDDNENYCIKASPDAYYHIGYLGQGIKSITDLARKIATEIREVESKQVSPSEVFFLTKRVEALEEMVMHVGGKKPFYM